MMFLYIKPFGLFSFKSGSHLLSHAVFSIVPSAAYVLTIVFGMRTGVSHKRIATRSFLMFPVVMPLAFPSPSASFGRLVLGRSSYNILRAFTALDASIRLLITQPVA